MKAEDTMMSKEQIDDLWQELWSANIAKGKNEPASLPVFSEAYRRKQARITFKMGIQEVVEWLREENDRHSQVLNGSFIIAKMDIDRWQAKLKEWGIDEKLDT